MKATTAPYKHYKRNSSFEVASQPWPIWRFTAHLGLLLLALLLAAPQGSARGASIWSDTTVPLVASADDAQAVELGLRFRSTVDGNITAIRFYKGASNTGTHVGSLWTATGALLGSVTFTNETASGWQQQALLSPVPITANTTYVVSYHAPVGGYSVDLGYFATSGVDNPPLRALMDGEDGPNGVYVYGVSSLFPTLSFDSANYWVDVVQTTVDNTPPTITCPADVTLQCADCNTDPSNTGTATATDDSGSVTVTYSDSVNGVCPKVVKRTWTATDAAKNTASCLQTITCQDKTPPTITCPADVTLQCADCNTDPSNTGTATATDDSGSATVTYSDSVTGVCPKVVKRTWTATDGTGNTASCVQTITCLPPTNLVTEGSGCIFDLDPTTPVQDFRLLYIQDPHNWPCYRIAASNPGQFFYNVFYTGSPGRQVTFSVTLPYPFVTQGANPIHAYDGMTVMSGGGRRCLAPGNAFFASSQQVRLSDYGNSAGAQTTIPVKLTVPPSGVVWLAVHVDFGLKGASGYAQNLFAGAVDCATGTNVLIPNHGSYTFSVDGAQTGSTSIQNVNSFKRIPGVAGLVLCKDTLNPVPGVSVTLANAMHIPVGSRVTDEDGFYMIAYKHKGKPSTYYVSIATPPPAVYTETKATTLKANAFVRLDFRAAACPNVAGESGTLALTTVTDRQALLSSPALLGNGTLECQVSGAAGQSYQIEASTNGTHWWPIYTNTDGGLFQFTDAKASNGSRRFYRAVLQQ